MYAIRSYYDPGRSSQVGVSFPLVPVVGLEHFQERLFLDGLRQMRIAAGFENLLPILL